MRTLSHVVLPAVLLLCCCAPLPLVGQTYDPTALAQSAPTASAATPQVPARIVLTAAALTRGATVTDVTLTGTAVWTLGSDQQTGTAKLIAKGTSSRIELQLSGGSRAEIRTTTPAGVPAGEWVGSDGVAHPMALHNCWSDPVWFVPALSRLVQPGADAVLSTEPSTTFDSVAVDQIVISRQLQGQSPKATASITRLSTARYLIDTTTNLPVAIRYSAHPDNNALTDIRAEVRFSDYRQVNGVQVPFRITKYLNGEPLLDVVITDVAINSGVPDSTFALN